MVLKFILLITYIIVVGFLFLDHARTHDGKFAQLEDFRNAMFNAIKSHEGLIFITTVFFVGACVGLIIGVIG